ncbi:MAG: sigma-54 dependent transcriptional regulator [Syntrophales bacterium]
MAHILIIDDDRLFSSLLRDMVEEMGHEEGYAPSLREGLKMLRQGVYDLVLLDVQLPDGDGLESIPGIRKMPSAPEVIIITGFGSLSGAELAIRNGVWDYIDKQASIAAMRLSVQRALQYREAHQGAGKPLVLKREGIIGASALLNACLEQVALASCTEASVLITGETGTGKELFAQAIHKNGNRADKPFVTIDCAALPATLVESVLFGYEKGAFTGADQARMGLIQQADGGVLFLDEVGELPLPVQRAFLRVIQERKVRPVGGKSEIPSRFRLIAATNRNLDEMVQQGNFRSDLLFRLRAMTIELPPLRRHPEDIMDICFYHMRRICRRHGWPEKSFSPDFMEAVTSYPWPGNVRELLQGLEQVMTIAQHEGVLFAKQLPPEVRLHLIQETQRENNDAASAPLPSLRTHRELVLAQAEADYLLRLMAITGGDMKEAGRLSGLSRPQLYAVMKKHRITRPPKASPPPLP